MDRMVQNWFERRMTARFQAKPGIFVKTPSGDSELPVIDISLGGLAFYSSNGFAANYAKPAGFPDEHVEFQILVGYDPLSIDKINGEIVSSAELKIQSDDRMETVTRHSLQFKNLSEDQRSSLNKFIEHHTTGKIF